MVVITRGNSGLVKDCNCKEYEKPAEDGNHDCSYCGCPPANHKRDQNHNDSNNSQSSAAMETFPETDSSAATGLLSPSHLGLSGRMRNMGTSLVQREELLFSVTSFCQHFAKNVHCRNGQEVQYYCGY